MHRLFVEKIAELTPHASTLLEEIRHYLEVNTVDNLRIFQRYDIQGLSDEQFKAATQLILSEPQIETTYLTLPLRDDETAFAYEYLPGQFDQRADSAAQCIQILTEGNKPLVASAIVIALSGKLSEADLSKIKNHLINKVDSREASLVPPPSSLQNSNPPADDIPSIPLIDTPSSALPNLINTHGLAMSLDDLIHCQAYFSNEEKRNPTLTEIKVLDTYWSDHCRHTTFLTHIDQVDFSQGTTPVQQAWQSYLKLRKTLERQDKPITLMDIALAGMRELRHSGELDNLEESEEINAASIIVPTEISHADGSTTNEEWLVMFKNETHNHPTEIEPFGGAATCLGGCIRDPLSGRSYVYQAMRVSGAADPTTPLSQTLPGKLPQLKICRESAHGYSSYGNQIGLATGQVAEIYHSNYVAKRLEIGAVVAATPRANVFRGTPAPGDAILLIGGRTGRDGIGGATGSSKEHTESALENSAEVQKGDAPTERKIQRLFRNPELARKIKVCNDFGAGGISVAIGEIAPSLDINLDLVPKKYAGLNGTDLAISESQERMAVCIDPSNIDLFIQLADQENLECVKVADVTDSGRLIMTWRGQQIVNLSRAFLDTNGVTQSANIKVASYQLPSSLPALSSTSLIDHLANLQNASQQGLGEMFDASVGAGTVLWPFGGKHQITPPDAMVAKLPLLEGNTDTCTYMSWGFDPEISSLSPFHGAVYAVTESVCKLVAAGAKLDQIRLTLQEYFPKLGNSPSRWGLPFAALLGAFIAQHKLRIAAIGGKDSMSGTFKDLDVPPTLVSFALAPGLANHATSPEFKSPRSQVSLVKIPLDPNELPEFDQLKATAATLHQLICDQQILALHHIGKPGLAVAIAKMAFGNHLGFKQTLIPESIDLDLFKPRFFQFIIEHQNPLPPSLSSIQIGKTTDHSSLEFHSATYPLDQLIAAYQGTLNTVYPTRAQNHKTTQSTSITDHLKDTNPPYPNSQTPSRKHQVSPIAKPKVIIPSFPGTNSEYDSAKKFNEAGAHAQILVFRNLTPQHIKESILALETAIKSSQILMLPGGFSAGDEPDGSGKFIATVLRNPRIQNAIHELINSRDGLILGICNGFQALIKTGLLPYGKVQAPSSDSPTLTFNDINRHISRYATTRIASTLSPWLSLCHLNQHHQIPLSHGEGKFIASEETLQQLIANRQIACQYIDPSSGQPSMHIDHNPNGSLFAIEAITSPCGRILGKMGHSERHSHNTSKNIPGNHSQPIFQAGTQYFS